LLENKVFPAAISVWADTLKPETKRSKKNALKSILFAVGL
jgi:hypothetical protein